MRLSLLCSEVIFLFLEDLSHLGLHLGVRLEGSLAQTLVDALGDLFDHELDRSCFVDQPVVVLDQLGEVLGLVPGALDILSQEVRGLQSDNIITFGRVALVVDRCIQGERGLRQSLGLLLAGGVGALEDL